MRYDSMGGSLVQQCAHNGRAGNIFTEEVAALQCSRAVAATCKTGMRLQNALDAAIKVAWAVGGDAWRRNGLSCDPL